MGVGGYGNYNCERCEQHIQYVPMRLSVCHLWGGGRDMLPEKVAERGGGGSGRKTDTLGKKWKFRII